MSRDTEKVRLFTRRAVLVGGLQFGVLSALAGRLYYLQILQKERFSTLAEDNRVNVRLIAPPRGQITDRNRTLLAINQQNYRLVALPEQVDDLQKLLDKLDRFMPLDKNEHKRIFKDFKNRDGLNAVLIHDNLTWEQVSAISLNLPELAGTDIEVGEVRTYPFAHLTTHVVGYVGPVSQYDKDKGRVSFAIPGFRIGKSGVEREYDEPLRGQPGDLQLEVNAHGRVVRELSRNEPVAGEDQRLTIDINLQKVLQQRLEKEQSAAGVVMDVKSGAVYALVSHPSYDPNLFTYGISQKDWDSLNNDEYVPLLNKVLDGVYAPGSTFKIVTALAGLEEGIITPTDTVFCPGHYDLGNHRFHCWKKGGHGPMNLTGALAGSCDTYFYEMGKRIGIDKIAAMARKLGFGEKTGIDFPHERSGLVPTRAWKVAKRGSNWQQGETLIAAIGQGYLLTSPMQLAVMMARIANGGFAVKPQIVVPPDGEWRDDKPDGNEMRFKQKNLTTLLNALSAVVNQPIGTAFGSRIMTEGFEMGGKTGTSQVRRISMAERAGGVITNDELPWKERDHALFVGFAPVDNPQYAAAVVIEHGGSGSHAAAPIVRDILEECQKLNVAGITRMPTDKTPDKAS
ncbi:MAG: penicillin-binding protein 2 [Alphaproteobacteria bacterium]|nr:penicillin-binding protein 2 [Alphaproteobacteria bacterium]